MGNTSFACFRNKDPQTRYTAVPNELLRDRRLTPETTWLIAYLLSHDPDFPVSLDLIRGAKSYPYLNGDKPQRAIGRDKLRKMTREAEAAGYLLRLRINNPTTGTFVWEFFAFGTPERMADWKRKHLFIETLPGIKPDGRSLSGESFYASPQTLSGEDDQKQRIKTQIEALQALQQQLEAYPDEAANGDNSDDDSVQELVDVDNADNADDEDTTNGSTSAGFTTNGSTSAGKPGYGLYIDLETYQEETYQEEKQILEDVGFESQDQDFEDQIRDKLERYPCPEGISPETFYNRANWIDYSEDGVGSPERCVAGGIEELANLPVYPRDFYLLLQKLSQLQEGSAASDVTLTSLVTSLSENIKPHSTRHTNHHEDARIAESAEYHLNPPQPGSNQRTAGSMKTNGEYRQGAGIDSQEQEVEVVEADFVDVDDAVDDANETRDHDFINLENESPPDPSDPIEQLQASMRSRAGINNRQICLTKSEIRWLTSAKQPKTLASRRDSLVEKLKKRAKKLERGLCGDAEIEALRQLYNSKIPDSTVWCQCHNVSGATRQLIRQEIRAIGLPAYARKFEIALDWLALDNHPSQKILNDVHFWKFKCNAQQTFAKFVRKRLNEFYEKGIHSVKIAQGEIRDGEHLQSDIEFGRKVFAGLDALKGMD